jgi:hypothetical protein
VPRFESGQRLRFGAVMAAQPLPPGVHDDSAAAQNAVRAEGRSCCSLQIANREPRTATANRKPQTANRKPQTANRKPQTANRKPQTANRKPQTVAARHVLLNAPDVSASQYESPSAPQRTRMSEKTPDGKCRAIGVCTSRMANRVSASVWQSQGAEGRFFIDAQFWRVRVRTRCIRAVFYNLGPGLQLGA